MTHRLSAGARDKADTGGTTHGHGRPERALGVVRRLVESKAGIDIANTNDFAHLLAAAGNGPHPDALVTAWLSSEGRHITGWPSFSGVH